MAIVGGGESPLIFVSPGGSSVPFLGYFSGRPAGRKRNAGKEARFQRLSTHWLGSEYRQEEGGGELMNFLSVINARVSFSKREGGEVGFQPRDRKKVRT